MFTILTLGNCFSLLPCPDAPKLLRFPYVNSKLQIVDKEKVELELCMWLQSTGFYQQYLHSCYCAIKRGALFCQEKE